MPSPLVNIAPEYGHGTMLKVNPNNVSEIEVIPAVDDGDPWRVVLIMASGRRYQVGRAPGEAGANTQANALETKLYP